ncbi:MAG: hypothetical protein AMJ56_16255, partial [Anaerolineae bacterium SG8_19]
EAEADQGTDVLSSYQLIQDAIDQKDDELFRTMLSGRNLEWAMSQQALFSRGLINDKRPLGLNPLFEEIEIMDVELGSSFQSAEVIVEHRYTVTDDVSLDNGYEWLITYDLRGCYSAVWANPRTIVLD